MTWKPQLTEHEPTALRPLAHGRHHVEIAQLLKVRPKTAGQLLHHAQIHLHARTLHEAVPHGCALGLIQPAPEPSHPRLEADGWGSSTR